MINTCWRLASVFQFQSTHHQSALGVSHSKQIKIYISTRTKVIHKNINQGLIRSKGLKVKNYETSPWHTIGLSGHISHFMKNCHHNINIHKCAIRIWHKSGLIWPLITSGVILYFMKIFGFHLKLWIYLRKSEFLNNSVICEDLGDHTFYQNRLINDCARKNLAKILVRRDLRTDEVFWEIQKNIRS